MDPYTSYYNNSYVFVFERNFDMQGKVEWAKRNYYLPYYVIVVYLVVIYQLQHFMKSRNPLELRIPLFFWNMMIAFLSFAGICRSLPAIFFHLKAFGFHSSICDNRSFVNVDLFWGWIFMTYKFVELGDTIFVVLRKHKLIFLHWYHHVTVLVTAWLVFIEVAAPARWMATINAFVHSVMYTYYAIRALKFHLPKPLSMFITCIQILQMVAGSYICGYIGYSRLTGTHCTISENVSNTLFIMYFTYFLLFVNYFYWTYVKPKSKSKTM